MEKKLKEAESSKDVELEITNSPETNDSSDITEITNSSSKKN